MKFLSELYNVNLKLYPMSKKSNQRADVKNPNNPAFKAAQDNRANQLNPEHLINKPEITVERKEKA